MRPGGPERLPTGPVVSADGVVFVLNANPDWQPVRVWFHLIDFGADTRFHRRGDQWVCRIPRPPVDRMEYLVGGENAAGQSFMITDPTNPHTARGAFGEHCVLEFPEYRPPRWLGHPARPGATEPLLVSDDSAEIVLTGDVWVPAGSLAEDPLPLLVVHDGPEYADLAGLLSYLSWLWETEPGLLCRVLLLKPVDRDRSYSASPGYARSLMDRALPLVTSTFRTTGGTVGLGASLGALALMHAAVTHPGVFTGLFLQSGSFFVPRFDGHEKSFRHYERVVRFVRQATAEPERLAGLDVSMTCGSGEENLHNNQRFAAQLERAGVSVNCRENRDGHNYGGWRDCLDPGLGELLGRKWTSEQ
jgi:enterochelin esterase-like enzyme